MSLLDQLSSLCISSTFPTNYFSISNEQTNHHNSSQTRQNYHLSSQAINNNSQQNISRNYNHSQQKLIKLFDDEELQPNWRMVNNTDTKHKSQSKHINKQSSSTQIKSSQFITQQQPKQVNNHSLLISLTKLSYLVKNKLRKVNYQFFVRLQNYSKQIKALNQQQLKQNNHKKLINMQVFVNKLNDTIGVISLKYYQTTNNNNDNNISMSQQLCDAFNKIRERSQNVKKMKRMSIICTKLIQRGFFNNFHLNNKRVIKIQLFQSLINTVVNKKINQNQRYFLKVLKQLFLTQININKTNSIVNKQELIEQSKQKYTQNQYQSTYNPLLYYQQQQKQQYQQQQKQQQYQQQPFSSPYNINLNTRYPLQQILINKRQLTFKFQQHITFNSSHNNQENIPLKLHSLKPHPQSFNINDCVDNGHLLMAQMNTNTKFKQQLQNLTISNINSKTSNSSSLNTSFITAYDNNFILPQFNNNNNNNNNNNDNNNNNNNNNDNDVTDRTIQEESSTNTMRKSVNPQQQKAKTTTFINQNPIKQPRKSLIITKRKQSLNQFNTYNNSLYNTDRQQVDIITNSTKKPKSTTTSTNKINQKHSTQVNDKNIIKKMLQQLNQKFQCHDKIINITLSNKKPTSTHKKQHNHFINSSQKKVQRKKIHSELIPTNFTLNCLNNQRQNSVKNSKVSVNTKNESKKSQKAHNQSQVSLNNVSTCFMPVQIIQKKGLNIIKKETTKHEDKPSEQRMKQSRSQLTKKNSNLWSQGSEDSEICKILSKYKTKKALFPESNLKIDLVTNQNNNDTQDSQKQANYCMGLSKPQKDQNKEKSFVNENKFNNSIFFRESLTNNFDESTLLNTSQLSLITPKQSKRDSFFNKKHSNPQLSTDRDSAIAQYIRYLPQQENYYHENQQENNSTHYTSLKPFDKKDNSQNVYYFETGSKKYQFKPVSSNTSIQKKRSSISQSRDQWDLMFEKQKNKFFKNQQVPKITKKKSLLNQEVISQIKNKIQQCFILSQKDQNSINTHLTFKKSKNQTVFSEEKNNQTNKNMSQQSSKKNSLSKLYTTLNKLRRPEQ